MLISRFKHVVIIVGLVAICDILAEELSASATLSFNDADEDEDTLREKRKLKHDPQTNKIIMIFPGENVDDKDMFRTEDFIFRIQSKYEYTECEKFSNDITKSNYFKYDGEVVNPEEGDGDNQARIKEKINSTLKRRYRLLNEECDVDLEREFWKEMFIIAENDTHRVGDNTSAYNLPMLRSTQLSKWNEVWIKYQILGICNQRLLLECYQSKCRCRHRGVGATTILGQGFTDDDSQFTTQRYYDRYDTTSKTDDYVRLYGEYKESLACVLTVPLDPNLANPCDFFMPNIGVCRTKCVENASCVDVSNDVQKTVEEQARKKAPDDQIRIKMKIHDKYHLKCECKEKTSCHRDATVGKNGGENVTVNVDLILGILLLQGFFFLACTKPEIFMPIKN